MLNKDLFVYPNYKLIGSLVVLSIYVALAVFQPYRDLKQEITNLWNRSGETGNRSLDISLRKPRA